MGLNGSSLLGKAEVHPLLLPLSCWEAKDLQAMKLRYTHDLGGTFALGLKEFAVLVNMHHTVAKPLFTRVFDTDGNRLVDAFEALSALTMLSKATSDEKLDFVHSLYDFSGTGEISLDELTIAIGTLISGCAKMDARLQPLPPEDVDQIARQAFRTAGKNLEHDISKPEFENFCRLSPAVQDCMAYWQAVASQANVEEGDNWRDDAFPSTVQSLTHDCSAPPPGSVPADCVLWLRPQEILHRLQPSTSVPNATESNRTPPPSGYAASRLRRGLGGAPAAGGLGTQSRIAPSQSGAGSEVGLAPLHEPVVFAQTTSGTMAPITGIAQGQLEDRWFLNALAIFSARPKLLRSAFRTTQQDHLGRYCIRFFKESRWLNVFVDDVLPCAADGSPLFARSLHGLELWPALVEKAYAKLHGGYSSLVGGSVGYALRDLTGGIVETVDVQATSQLLVDDALRGMGHTASAGSPEASMLRVATDKAVEQFWQELVKWHGGLDEGGERFLVGCLFSSKDVAEKDRRVTEEDREGLLSDRAYTVERLVEIGNQRFIRLRNAWGFGQWRGAWGADSQEYRRHPDVGERLAREEAKEFKGAIDEQIRIDPDMISSASATLSATMQALEKASADLGSHGASRGSQSQSHMNTRSGMNSKMGSGSVTENPNTPEACGVDTNRVGSRRLWITLRDFMGMFNQMVLCQVPQPVLADDDPEWKAVNRQGQWDQGSGGAPIATSDAWARVPQFLVEVEDNTEAVAVLTQQDNRLRYVQAIDAQRGADTLDPREDKDFVSMTPSSCADMKLELQRAGPGGTDSDDGGGEDDMDEDNTPPADVRGKSRRRARPSSIRAAWSDVLASETQTHGFHVDECVSDMHALGLLVVRVDWGTTDCAYPLRHIVRSEVVHITRTYERTRDYTVRFSLTPGKYVVVPLTSSVVEVDTPFWLTLLADTKSFMVRSGIEVSWSNEPREEEAALIANGPVSEFLSQARTSIGHCTERQKEDPNDIAALRDAGRLLARMWELAHQLEAERKEVHAALDKIKMTVASRDNDAVG